jgi:hypothetical protein
MERLTNDIYTACMDCAGETMGCRPVNKDGKYNAVKDLAMQNCPNRARYDRLRELENKLESGLMLELPIPIGGEYYRVHKDFNIVCGPLHVYNWNALTIAENFGKTTFRTREEAISAKEQSNGEA